MLDPEEHYSFSTFMLGWWSTLIPKNVKKGVEESNDVKDEDKKEKQEATQSVSENLIAKIQR